MLCFSEHAKDDDDGVLAMWTEYGNRAKGVAIVLDTAKLERRDESFLIVAKVHYGTKEQRLNQIEELVGRFADLLKGGAVPDDKLVVCSFYLFQRLKLFSIFTKHGGFKGETEWRIVYMRDIEESQLFDHMISYWNGPRGLEPKLKLKIGEITGLPETDNLSLSNLIDRIILGPASPEVAENACAHMVESLGYPELKDRIRRSTIPYRA